MSTLAKSVSFDAAMMWVDMTDGRKLGVPLAYFPRLLAAKPQQLLNYEISGGGSGLHWDELDEDISVEALLAGVGDLTRTRQLAAQGISVAEGKNEVGTGMA